MHAGKLADKEILLRLDTAMNVRPMGWAYVKDAQACDYEFKAEHQLPLHPQVSIQWQRSRTGCAANCAPSDLQDIPYVVLVLTVRPLWVVLLSAQHLAAWAGAGEGKGEGEGAPCWSWEEGIVHLSCC